MAYSTAANAPLVLAADVSLVSISFSGPSSDPIKIHQ